MEEENIIASRKIRFKPTPKQLIFFNRCFGATRYLHNRAVKLVNSKKKQKKYYRKQAKSGCIHENCKRKLYNTYFCKKHKKEKLKYNLGTNFFQLRKILLTPNKHLTEDESWLKDIPYDTRQLSLKNFSGNYKAALTNTKRKNIKGFQMKFLTRKSKKQFFHVDHRAISLKNERIFLCKKSLKEPLNISNKRDFEWLLEKIDEMKDFIITREHPSHYYLHIPHKKEIIEEVAEKDFVSIDPGVRTFHTFYDGKNYGKIGDSLAVKINRILRRVDKLQSLVDIFEGSRFKRTRRNLRKRCSLLRIKVRNIVDDHHWKACKFYLDNYKNIIIPQLDTKSIKRSIKKTLKTKSSTVVRRMMSLSHGKFIKRLKYKVGLYRDRKLFIVDESYTSKTCGNCGKMNNELGSSDTFNCTYCEICMDRDVNGARNILLKMLLEHLC